MASSNGGKRASGEAVHVEREGAQFVARAPLPGRPRILSRSTRRSATDAGQHAWDNVSFFGREALEREGRNMLALEASVS